MSKRESYVGDGAIITACEILEKSIKTNGNLKTLLLEYGLSDYVPIDGSIAKTMLALKEFTKNNPGHLVKTDTGEKPLSYLIVDLAIHRVGWSRGKAELWDKLERYLKHDGFVLLKEVYEDFDGDTIDISGFTLDKPEPEDLLKSENEDDILLQNEGLTVSEQHLSSAKGNITPPDSEIPNSQFSTFQEASNPAPPRSASHKGKSPHERQFLENDVMAARVFMSYSHKDQELRDQLEVHLNILERQGLVEVWHDRRLVAGDYLDQTISKELERADIILLLVSPDFLASDYCYDIEKARALERHREGSARLISVILRPCEWEHTDLREYIVTPTDGRAVTRWPDRDEALLDVAQSIRRAIEEMGKTDAPNEVYPFIDERAADQTPEPLPRSSNLRLRKQFTQADEDRFLLDAFEYMDRFFQGSLGELQKRDPGVEGRFRRIDGNTFTAAIYRNGNKEAACTIRLGGGFGNGITFSNSDNVAGNSFNASLSVEKDNQKLFLRPLGIARFGMVDDKSALSHEGAAEYFWSLLIEPLQGE